MGYFCAVEGCNNTSYSYEGSSGFKFFRFPSESHDDRILWWILCGRRPEGDDLTANMMNSRVCSKHFPPDFHSASCIRQGKQLSGCKCSPKGKLPSLYLPKSVTKPETVSKVHNFYKRKLVPDKRY